MKLVLEPFFDQVISVKCGPERECVDILDETLLPGKAERIQIRDRAAMVEAIQKLRVRGAPAIGIFAAFGLAVLSKSYPEEKAAFFRQLEEDQKVLSAARPTAVNLSWALERMVRAARAVGEKPAAAVREALFAEAEAIQREDVSICRGIGENGFAILEEIRKKQGEKPLGILTHCNAGTLATSKYGTATAPMYVAIENGWKPEAMHVYCDETRPLLQGARLTSFELSRAGIPTSVQCDDMASLLMQSGKIQVIFVGCDRVADNGDAANKIGTSGLAILAKYYGIPFYVCAPTPTIDRKTKTGADIPIEMRNAEEIKSLWYREPMVPEGVDTSFNPAFDVTDHSLITGILTERGICQAPYGEAFSALGID